MSYKDLLATINPYSQSKISKIKQHSKHLYNYPAVVAKLDYEQQIQVAGLSTHQTNANRVK